MGLSKEDFNSKDIGSVDKVITVLKYLNQGREIDFGYPWPPIRLGETKRGGFQFMGKYHSSDSKDGVNEETWLGQDMKLTEFSELCKTISDEKITIMQANMALTQMNKRSNREVKVPPPPTGDPSIGI